MDIDKLTVEIKNLISTRREDDWWDFKREHHHNKADLVHDIICMANNRPRRDSYIIFGVENDTYNVIGVENNEKRRNQQCITDLLKNIAFAGGVRPRIEIHTIIIENHKIDVLIVKDSLNVPYYIEKEYTDKNRKVRPYHIYTRVADTNTPINMQADINDIEFLWRKRFGIDLSIMERLNILLEEYDKWVFEWDNKKYCYHTDYPEFQIVQDGDFIQDWVPAAAFYAHPGMHSAKLNIVYHSTVIYETELWVFDEYRNIYQKPQILR